MSTASSSEIAITWCPRGTEASILAQLLRGSRLTVLCGEAGAGKTTLLENGVLPLLRRRASDRDFTMAHESRKELPFPDRRRIYCAAERAPEVAIFFDEWNEAPLAALDARLSGALPVCPPRVWLPASSMAKRLGAWNKELAVRFLIIFDGFDEYLAASRAAPGIREFGEQFVQILNDDRLPANFLLALRDERPLLERFEGRIAGLGDASLRLPSWYRFIGSLRENEHRAEPYAAAPPDHSDATSPALRPTPDSGLHTITAASRLGDCASPVLKTVSKSDLQTVRATSVVVESPSPDLKVTSEFNSHTVPAAFELVESPPPILIAIPACVPAAPELVESPSPVVKAEPNSQTAPRVSEVADSASPVRLLPTLNLPAPHGLNAQRLRANGSRLNRRVKPAWLALPLVGIFLLLIVLTNPLQPGDATLSMPSTKEPAANATNAQQTAEREASELRRSLEQEREKAAALERNLASARREAETEAVRLSKATDEAASLKQSSERSLAELRDALKQERQRAEVATAAATELRQALAREEARRQALEQRLAAPEAPRSATIADAANVPRTPAATERSTAAETQRSASDITRLMARANALLAQGDIVSARIVLERAVDMGSPKAAFALAETYDPIILTAWRTFGTLSDVVRAKQLYAKAQASGVQGAQDRLNALRER